MLKINFSNNIIYKNKKMNSYTRARTLRRNLLILFMLLITNQFIAAQKVDSDKWSVTDALNRKVREYPDAGDKREKFVAIFYWTWHQGKDDTTITVKNITEIIRMHPKP